MIGRLVTWKCKGKADESRWTYNKRLVKLGAQHTLLPVIPKYAPNRLGCALLDRIGQPRAVVCEFLVEVGVSCCWRREPGTGNRLSRWWRLAHGPRSRRVHNDRS